MTPFFETAGQRALDEMQKVMVPAGGTVPPGTYGFLELYCNESGCDCRRVVIYVVRPDDVEKVWATLNFGWETAEYYRRWSGDAGAEQEMASATLEPTGPQTRHAAALLRLFQGIVESDPAYVDRLRFHYAEARAAAGGTTADAAEVGRLARQRFHEATAGPERRLTRTFPREGFTIFTDSNGVEIRVDEYHAKPLRLGWAMLDRLRREARQPQSQGDGAPGINR
jgi:hypothetical protein